MTRSRDPKLPVPVAVYPFFDKIAFWLKEPADAATLAVLEGACGNLHIRREGARFDATFRQRLELKQPQPSALRWMANQVAYINSVEVALDFIFANWATRDDTWEFLNVHLVRRWHGKQSVRIIKTTRYDARRAARNNTVLYRQEYSRVTGELHALHFEWRAKGVRAVRAAGIRSGKDLLDFDHRKFWERRLLLYRVDAERLGRYWRNQIEGRKSRIADHRDRRTGHVICSGCDTMQDLIDQYGPRFRIQRVMEKMPVDAFLPPSTITL